MTWTSSRSATSRAQQMLYAVTAQSHYRAMALLTHDDKYNAQIADNKKTFSTLLDQMDVADPADAQLLHDLRTANETYAAASEQVLALYLAGDLDGASKLHLQSEHPISHVLEAGLHSLITSADQQITEAQAAFDVRPHSAHQRRGRLLGRERRSSLFSSGSSCRGRSSSPSARWAEPSAGSRRETSASVWTSRTAMSSATSPWTSTEPASA